MSRRFAPCGLAALACAAALLASDPAYQTEILQWRATHDSDLRSPKGPLYLVARHTVPEGRTKIGSGASADIRLPDRAPEIAGMIIRRGDKIAFAPTPGIAVDLNGKPMSGPSPLHTEFGAKPRDKVGFGDFEISITGVDGIFQLAVGDKKSPYLEKFQGPIWFPVDATYRIEAEFTAYPKPKVRRIPDTTGRSRTADVPGYVTFSLNGGTYRLEPTSSGDGLFFMFKDLTSNHETYGAGRYLEADKPKDGKVLLDFNKAFNPYCAFNPYSSCPVPPKENRLNTRLEAGEKYRANH